MLKCQHVRGVLRGQVSLAAVNQNLCSSLGYERLQKSRDSLKDCFENVNIELNTCTMKYILFTKPPFLFCHRFRTLFKCKCLEYYIISRGKGMLSL